MLSRQLRATGPHRSIAPIASPPLPSTIGGVNSSRDTKRTYGAASALGSIVLALSLFPVGALSTPASAATTTAPTAIAAVVTEMNILNERAATDPTLDLSKLNKMYKQLWTKAKSKGVSLSIPQPRDTAQARRAARFATYAQILNLSYRGTSYCVVADKFITQTAPIDNAWHQSLVPGACSKYFKVVIL